MKTTYFCHSHAVKIVRDETYAFTSWREMMRRGVRAYERCSSNAIEIYLTSAIEIALIRHGCPENKLFDESKIEQPLVALMDYFLIQNAYSHCITVLSRVSNQLNHNHNHNRNQHSVSEKYLSLMESLYTRVNEEEKTYFLQCESDGEVSACELNASKMH